MAPVFPVAGGTFSNTFRWPLAWDSGNDIFAPKGTPVVAIYDGVLAKVGNDGGKGGNRLWVTNTGNGNFYYAHLDHYAPGIKDGVKVKAGQVIAYVGNTGNAYKGGAGAPHVHFGWSATYGTIWNNPFALLTVAKGGKAPIGPPSGLMLGSQDTGTTLEPHNPRPMIVGTEGGGVAHNKDGSVMMSTDQPAAGNDIVGYLDRAIVGPLKLHAQFYALIAMGLVLVGVAFREPIIEAGTKAAKTAALAAI